MTSQARRRKRESQRLTKHEIASQKKVGQRYFKMRLYYNDMSLSELEQIKDIKRSVTDQHAYSETLRQKSEEQAKKESEKEIKP